MKKSFKWIMEFLSFRLLLFFLVFAIQLLLLLQLSIFVNKRFPIPVRCLNAVLVIWIINKKMPMAHKLAWVALMLLFSQVGGFFYLFLCLAANRKRANTNGSYALGNEIEKYSNAPKLPLDDRIQGVVNYLKNHSFPAYQPEAIQYFPEVSRGVPDMLKAIDAAKTYIFFESFIIKEGEMWSRLLEVLEKKAKEGVEVRLAYDAYGCINLPLGFSQKLREKGIKCRAINKIPLLLNFNINNRSHVKLTIVDGEVAFVMEGNIGDEYINKTQPYGHWKDGIMMLRGAPVNSIVAIFLKLWHFGEDLDTEQIFENEKYFKKPEKPASMAPSDNNSSGLVVPFYCWPSAAEPIYENVYLQLLNSAKKEVVFVAPYYIPSDRFLDACVMVAKKGISVSLITPATYNSVGAKLLTRRFFPQLLAAGVNIYEYTPGFIHCKSMLVDSVCGVFGTANMDYRSFYSAFEAGVVLANPEAVAQLAADYTHTIQQSHKVTIEDCTSGPLIVVGTMLLTLIIAVF